jgi:hypothetical protein
MERQSRKNRDGWKEGGWEGGREEERKKGGEEGRRGGGGGVRSLGSDYRFSRLQQTVVHSVGGPI